jgi:hypothetical protein
MRWVVAVLWCWSVAWPAVAQTTADPSLHRRGASTSPDQPSKAGGQSGSSTLPSEASGEYMLDESGSVIQITLDSGKLTGYVTKMGDEQADKDTPLTLFFDQTSARGSHLSFTTRKVHGTWYSFDGTIVRGDPKTTLDEDGYYRLKGVWVVHDDGRKTQSSETVSFKSTPRFGSGLREK